MRKVLACVVIALTFSTANAGVIPKFGKIVQPPGGTWGQQPRYTTLNQTGPSRQVTTITKEFTYFSKGCWVTVTAEYEAVTNSTGQVNLKLISWDEVWNCGH